MCYVLLQAASTGAVLVLSAGKPRNGETVPPSTRRLCSIPLCQPLDLMEICLWRSSVAAVPAPRLLAT